MGGDGFFKVTVVPDPPPEATRHDDPLLVGLRKRGADADALGEFGPTVSPPARTRRIQRPPGGDAEQPGR